MGLFAIPQGKARDFFLDFVEIESRFLELFVRIVAFLESLHDEIEGPQRLAHSSFQLKFFRACLEVISSGIRGDVVIGDVDFAGTPVVEGTPGCGEVFA